MNLRVLGCSGSIALDNRTTSFLLDEHVLVDAGTGVGDLTLDELAAIDHIILTHSHLDHVLGIPLIADSVGRRRFLRGGGGGGGGASSGCSASRGVCSMRRLKRPARGGGAACWSLSVGEEPLISQIIASSTTAVHTQTR